MRPPGLRDSPSCWLPSESRSPGRTWTRGASTRLPASPPRHLAGRPFLAQLPRGLEAPPAAFSPPATVVLAALRSAAGAARAAPFGLCLDKPLAPSRLKVEDENGQPSRHKTRPPLCNETHNFRACYREPWRRAPGGGWWSTCPAARRLVPPVPRPDRVRNLVVYRMIATSFNHT